jgi:hypothetical protein
MLPRTAGRIVMSVTYGLPVDTPDSLVSSTETTCAELALSIVLVHHSCRRNYGDDIQVYHGWRPSCRRNPHS